MSLGKTLQSPSLILVKARKDMNNVSCRRDMTEILLKAAWNTIQSINKSLSILLPGIKSSTRAECVGQWNSQSWLAPHGWLSGKRVGLMTWWLCVRSPVEATFVSGVFSPLTSAEACEKSNRWLWKEKLCYYWCEKARKHICVTDRHDMTLLVKVALNPKLTHAPGNGMRDIMIAGPPLYLATTDSTNVP